MLYGLFVQPIDGSGCGINFSSVFHLCIPVIMLAFISLFAKDCIGRTFLCPVHRITLKFYTIEILLCKDCIAIDYQSKSGYQTPVRFQCSMYGPYIKAAEFCSNCERGLLSDCNFGMILQYGLFKRKQKNLTMYLAWNSPSFHNWKPYRRAKIQFIYCSKPPPLVQGS